MDTNKPLGTNPPPVQPAPESVVPPQTPNLESTVVIPEKKDKLPVWFYFLFAVVAVIFFSVTFLLGKTLLGKINQSKTPVPASPTEAVSSPSASPTAIPTPEDEYLKSLNKTGESDEVSDIEADLNASDLQELKSDFTKIEAETNTSQQN